MNPELHVLVRKRGEVKSRITKLKTFLGKQSNTSPDSDDIQIRVDALIEHFKSNYTIYEELMLIDPDHGDTHGEELEKMEDEYYSVLSESRKLIRVAQQIDNAPNIDQSQQTALVPNTSIINHKIKLPEIPLPKFDGQIEEWQTFRDKFLSRIGNNTNIPEIDKLQYLQAAVSGKAARAIESLNASNTTYKEVWEILVNKFDNTRKAILRHWSILHNLPRLTKDTPEALDELIDTFRQHIRALVGLGEAVDTWHSCIIYLLLSKINNNTKYHWETTLEDNKMPEYTSLLNFLEKRGSCSEQYQYSNANCKPLFKNYREPQNSRDSVQPRKSLVVTNKNNNNQSYYKQNISNNDADISNNASNHYQANKPKILYPCPICKEMHKIYICPSFNQASVQERIVLAEKAALCENCLTKGHSYAECKGKLCSVCNQKHHTMFHPERAGKDKNKQYENIEKPVFKALAIDAPSNDIIPTAQFYLIDKNNNKIPCRAIIDTGSSTNFITSEVALSLNLILKKCHIPVGTLNEMQTFANHWITTTIYSKNHKYQKTIDFLIVPKITSTPDQYIDRSAIDIPANIKLADPEFHVPRNVSLLLGAGISISLFSVGQIKLTQTPNTEIYLQKTLAGWIVGGTFSEQNENNSYKAHLTNMKEDISRFWELEEPIIKKYLSKEETECEEHFQRNVKRNKEGRYIVALPFNNRKDLIGSSREMAIKRLLGLEKRFKKDTDLFTQYKQVIEEYIKLKHMVKVDGDPEDGFFLPHHAVIKLTSSTTKVRVVFDGSAASSSGISLNDALMVGPTIQDDLLSFVLWFRIPNYLITGDIEKMFRQILVREEDQKYLRILWREDDGSIATYQMTADTFGLGPASFLAVRTITQLAQDERERFPLAAKSLIKRLYVDDYIDGAKTINETIELRDQMIELLKAGGFNLRQFASNSPQVLAGLPDCHINKQIIDKNDYTLKTLGMYWDSQKDLIKYTVNPISTQTSYTKRIIFSEISKIFDPLGLLNPSIVIIKLLMQDIWKLKLDWDESLPQNINDQWKMFVSQLGEFNEISFDRKLLHNEPVNIQLHGFCDASEKAYGACIYLRSIDHQGHIKVNLLCAKSRVAPIKTIQTIPKLELCAAILLTKLFIAVNKSLELKFDQTLFWTDSMIVFHWLHKSPNQLMTFVANRVSEIQSNTNISDWRHVRTYDNPADLLSRGILPADLRRSKIWQTGPKWLNEETENWPKKPAVKNIELPELRKSSCFNIKILNNEILQRFSSYEKLERFIGICLRIVNKVKDPKLPLTVRELKLASNRIIKIIQLSAFSKEIAFLSNKNSIPSNSKILSLRPFLDTDGILRVGGRLQNSDLNYNYRHPVLLPRSDYVTKLIILREHINGLHSGIKLTLNNLHTKYWPLDGKNQVRHIVRKCVRCAKVDPPAVNYVMANLPKVRTTMCRPFLNTGLDYCGPFFIKEKKFKNKTKIKIYIAIFICMSVKAVHLEAVSDLTTESFIGALRRFISRRGLCVSIHSDNGTNFVGANREFKELSELLNNKYHNDSVQKYLTNKGISWHFIPPRSPHVGGIWEAGVKSFKYHMRRVIGNDLYTFEQFNTLTTEIEAILNSRPLTYMSCDPNDPITLTPAHLLIGGELMSLPEVEVVDIPSNRLSVWKQITKIKQLFWSKWHKEYLHELNVRQKWTKGEHNIKLGSIVLIREENIPSLQWLMGRVIDANPDSDGIIRKVRIRTSTGELIRNVKRLALLPIDTDLNN